MEAETTESAFASVLNVCGVCKENLHGREPKLLSCLHVFCKQCVLNLVESKYLVFHTQVSQLQVHESSLKWCSNSITQTQRLRANQTDHLVPVVCISDSHKPCDMHTSISAAVDIGRGTSQL